MKDRGPDSSEFRANSGYGPQTWFEMIADL